MKAKKLFPDLSIRRLWNKVNEVDNKVNGQNSRGCFIDVNNTICDVTPMRTGSTYTANEDCFVYLWLAVTMNMTSISLNGITVIESIIAGDGITVTHILPLKAGDILKFDFVGHDNSEYRVFGVR